MFEISGIKGVSIPGIVELTMITTIIVIGKSGSGKTELVSLLQQLFETDGYHVHFLSDRIGLEDAVLRDTIGGIVDESGAIIGPHSKLIADGPPGHRKVHVLDGVLLNAVHREMVDTAATAEGNTVTILEYAIGNDIDFGEGKVPLLQSASHLIHALVSRDFVHDSLVIDVEASLEARALRNERRADGLDPKTFALYFGDGGELPQQTAILLGDHYFLLENGFHDMDAFRVQAEQIYRGFVVPRLTDGAYWSEGVVTREQEE